MWPHYIETQWYFIRHKIFKGRLASVIQLTNKNSTRYFWSRKLAGYKKNFEDKGNAVFMLSLRWIYWIFLHSSDHLLKQKWWFLCKNWVKILKSDYQGIGPEFWYPQNQHYSLNHFQFFQIKNRSLKNVLSISNPGIQPTHMICAHWFFFWK